MYRKTDETLIRIKFHFLTTSFKTDFIKLYILSLLIYACKV